MLRSIERFLGLRSLPFILASVAVLLVLPSAWTGLQQDDLDQRYFLHGYADSTGGGAADLDIFAFLRGDSAGAHRLMDAGVAPWWTLPSLRLAFWRPLAALMHYLDYLLWPDRPFLMHAQSFLWFFGLIVAGAYLYRRYLGATVTAGIAAAFFALDDVHGLAAGWIANRNAMMALLAGCLILIVHDRWRRDGWVAGSLLGPLFLAAGLLSGESALAVCGYLLSYALFLDNGTIRMRIRSLLPYALVAGVWLVVRARLGYGTWGSGYYIDPLSEPLRFLEAVGMRSPLLIADQMFFPPSSLALFLGEHLLSPLLIWGVVIVVLFAFLLWPLIRADRVSRFWATGMLLSVPIVCTALPHSRLLMFTGLGAFGLIAIWIQRARACNVRPGEPRTHVRVRRWAVFLLIAVHGPMAALSLMYNASSAAFAQKYIQDAALTLVDDGTMRSTDLMIVNHPIPFYAHHAGTARLVLGSVPPRRIRVLAPGLDSVHIVRPDSATLLVRPCGGFIGSSFDNVFRGPAHPMMRGEQVRLTGITAEVVNLTDDGRPSEVRFTVNGRLEDPRYRWVRWEANRYVPFQLPPVGGSADLPGSPLEF